MKHAIVETRPGRALVDGMVPIPGGRFAMGSADFYPEEAPVRVMQVAPFLIDVAPVTNRQFAAFVAATAYVTLAERPPDPALYPGILADRLEAGSIVFVAPERTGGGVGPESWWHFVAGANWRAPYGPASGVVVGEAHPVVQIAYEDAAAYARWAGKALPTDAQMEFAARGGRDGAAYAWGETLRPERQELANIWYEGFPFARANRPGPPYTTPVGSYPANDYGVFDLIGNVWEWTCTDAGAAPGSHGCCAAKGASVDPARRKVLKGGSHLCAPNYCRRYRPAAKWPQPVDTSTTHVGFRCVRAVE